MSAVNTVSEFAKPLVKSDTLPHDPAPLLSVRDLSQSGAQALAGLHSVGITPDVLRQFVAPPQNPLLVNIHISALTKDQAVTVFQHAVEERSLQGVTWGDLRKQMGDPASDVIAKILKTEPYNIKVDASTPVANTLKAMAEKIGGAEALKELYKVMPEPTVKAIGVALIAIDVGKEMPKGLQAVANKAADWAHTLGLEARINLLDPAVAAVKPGKDGLTLTIAPNGKPGFEIKAGIDGHATIGDHSGATLVLKAKIEAIFGTSGLQPTSAGVGVAANISFNKSTTLKIDGNADFRFLPSGAARETLSVRARIEHLLRDTTTSVYGEVSAKLEQGGHKKQIELSLGYGSPKWKGELNVREVTIADAVVDKQIKATVRHTF